MFGWALESSVVNSILQILNHPYLAPPMLLNSALAGSGTFSPGRETYFPSFSAIQFHSQENGEKRGGSRRRMCCPVSKPNLKCKGGLFLLPNAFRAAWREKEGKTFGLERMTSSLFFQPRSPTASAVLKEGALCLL